MTDSPPAQPVLRILTPDTTPEETAAIVAVLASLGGSEPAPEPPRSAWADPAHRLHGAPVRSWRASGLPR